MLRGLAGFHTLNAVRPVFHHEIENFLISLGTLICMSISLVYVQDALRKANCSAYGYERDTTPHMSELAAEGVTLTGIAPSTWTKPVAASILSGRRPHAHGTVYRDSMFDAERFSITTALPNDVTTAAFISNGYIDASFGFDYGFDVFEEFYVSEDNWTVGPGIVTEAVVEFVEGLSNDEDAFILVWTIGPHLPYDTADSRWGDADSATTRGGFRSEVENIGRQHMLNRYDDQIRENDEELGRLVETLKRSGRYSESCVVVAGDHGELFGEGFEGRAMKGYGHGKVVPYQQVTEVPLVMKPPSGMSEELEDGQLSSLVDIPPTVCEVHGSPAPRTVQGCSMFQSGYDRKHCFVQVPGSDRQGELYRSVRTNAWNFITVEHTGTLFSAIRDGVKSWIKTGLLLDEYLLPIKDGVEQYDNRLAEMPEIGEQLREIVVTTAERDHRSVTAEQKTEKLEGDVRQNLEELGYLG